MTVVFLHAGVAEERSWPGPGVASTRTDELDLPVHVLVGDLDLPRVQERCRTIAALERPDAVLAWVGAT